MASRAIVQSLPIGIRWTIPFAISSLAWGVAFGIAATARMPAELAVAMSGLMISGTAQLMAVEMWRSPLPLLPILLAALSVNVRYLAMGATLAPYYRERRGGLWATALLSDASWVVALRAEREGYDLHRALAGSNALMWLAWVGGTLVGALAGTMIPEAMLGALTLFTLALLATLLPSLTQSWRAVPGPLVAAALAAASASFVAGSWAMLGAGLAGALVSYGVIGEEAGAD